MSPLQHIHLAFNAPNVVNCKRFLMLIWQIIGISSIQFIQMVNMPSSSTNITITVLSHFIYCEKEHRHELMHVNNNFQAVFLPFEQLVIW